MVKVNDGERMAVLETKMDALAKGQEKQSEKFDTLNSKLDELLPTYATKVDIESLKKRNTLQTWLTGTFSAIFGSVLTFLVMYFVTTIGGR